MEFLIVLYLLACIFTCRVLLSCLQLYKLSTMFSQLYLLPAAFSYYIQLYCIASAYATSSWYLLTAWELYSTIGDLTMCENVCLPVLSMCCDFKDFPPPHSSPMRGATVKHTKDSESANQNVTYHLLSVPM